MASYLWFWELSGGQRKTSNSSRSRCTFKYFTKTGIFLTIAIILSALPWCLSRPLEDSDYVYSTDDVNAKSRSLEEAVGRFEFQRKISSSLKSTNSSPSGNKYANENVRSLDVISNPLSNNNSSMIVHVIVTSSSSTSSSEQETDTSEPQEFSTDDNVQYTIAEDEVDKVNASAVEFNETAVVEITLPEATLELVETVSPPEPTAPVEVPLSSGDVLNEQLEIRKLSPSQNKEEEPTHDIFSAFYRAFSESSASPTPVASQGFPTGGTISSFMRPHRHRSNLHIYQQRRYFRNRQQDKERKGSEGDFQDGIVTGDPLPTNLYSKEDSVVRAVEETEKKLESLAKKIDKSDKEIETSVTDHHDTINSSPKVTPLPSSSSTSPSKIAVSVAVTHSKSVAATAGKRGASSPDIHSANGTDEIVDQELRQWQRSSPSVGETGGKQNAKSESFQLLESIQTTISSPIRSKPLIKSFVRNDATASNNTNENFPKSLSRSRSPSSSSEHTGVKNISNKNSAKDINNTKDNESNFHIRARNNIIQLSRGGDGDRTLFAPRASSHINKHFVPSNPKAEPSSFVETTARPFPPFQRRKLTRTVSGDIGDPSSFLFNINSNHKSTPRTTTLKTSTTPKNRNWQEPEKVWSEPARIWGVPAKVWGEPAKVWSEPAKVWGQQEKVWDSPRRAHPQPLVTKTPEPEEPMQSDQPLNQQPEDQKQENDEDELAPQGTFVILGDDENEDDSIDGDLGRPLMMHHIPIPPTNTNDDKSKETVVTSSISTSITSSSSSKNGELKRNFTSNIGSAESYSRQVAQVQSQQDNTQPPPSSPFNHSPDGQNIRDDTFDPSISNNRNSDSSEITNSSTEQQKKSGKKFGYVIEGANVRKYRVEERTPDGYIVGEYGVLNNQNAFLRGVRYTADGTINPRLIHEALMKFLSL